MNTIKNLLNKDNIRSIDIETDLNNIQQTKSYVCLHLGLNRSAKDLDFKNTNLWVYPDYDHDKSVKRYLHDETSEFPVVYISFPSAKDDSWNELHPNSATMEAITLSQWNWYRKWEKLKWKKDKNLNI